jgi:hypothetical protein
MWIALFIVGSLLLNTLNVKINLLCPHANLFKSLIIPSFLFSCITNPGFSQQTSKNNYIGAWETSTSWTPTWTTPSTSLSGTSITIYGYITVNGPLSFGGSSSNLTIYDTLVVKGDLTLGSNIDLNIQDGGVLIVEGNLTAGNNTAIAANSYIVVTGNFSKSGSASQGSFTTNDNPANVFIGGTISPAELTNSANFPAINCTSPPTTPYPNSTCSYGNSVDVVNNPINTFLQSICTELSITTQPSNESICSGSNSSFMIAATGATSYMWLVNTGSGYVAISNGGVYSGAITATLTLTAANASYNGYTYRCLANNGICSKESNTATLSITSAAPAQPSSVTGTSTLCAGTSLTYSVTNIAGVTYTWVYSGTGATITGNGANSIEVSYSSSATSGTLSVTPSNSCGNGAVQTLGITINSLPPTTVIHHDQ